MDLLNVTVQPDMSTLDVDLIYTFRAGGGAAESIRSIAETGAPKPQTVSLSLPVMFNIPGSVQFYAVTERHGWHSMTFNYIVYPCDRIDVIIDYPAEIEIKAVVKRLL